MPSVQLYTLLQFNLFSRRLRRVVSWTPGRYLERARQNSMSWAPVRIGGRAVPATLRHSDNLILIVFNIPEHPRDDRHRRLADVPT